jgi:4-amino-4-deoxy-L-arabinose transferase-like glycosyltransferase
MTGTTVKSIVKSILLTKDCTLSSMAHRTPLEHKSTNTGFSVVKILRKLFSPLSKNGIAPAIAFLAPAALSIYFTFGGADYNRGLVWDSAHYLLSAQSLLTWLTACLHGHYISPATIDLGPSIMVDGPVLPAFGAALIGLGNVFHLPAETSILLGQSMVCGFNSLLLYTLAARLVDRKFALAGALLFGFDPATIVSASQFLTEQLTVTTLLSMTLAVALALPKGRLNNVSPPNLLQYAAWIVLGALATLILHIKTALFPTVALVLFLALITRAGPIRRKGKILVALGLGFFVCLLPWLIFSKLASGRMSLSPNRVPSINLAVGLDLESDAWGVAPPAESVLPIIFDKPSAIAVSLWQANPVKLTSLFLRKVERLFAYSWNDFGWPVLGLTTDWQCFLQRLLLAWALLGSIYIVGQEKLLKNTLGSLSNGDFLKLTILLMVAGHFIFIPFETQPRYGFSAVPYFIILASIAGQRLAEARIFPYSYLALSLLTIVLSSSDFSGTLLALTGSIETAIALDNLILSLLFGLTLMVGCALGLGQERDLRRETVLMACSTLIAFCALAFKGLYLAPPEWPCTLAPGTVVQRQIELPPALARQWLANATTMPTWAAALIDGDQDLASAQVTINGKPALGTPMAMLDVEQAYGFQSTIRELAKMAARTRGQEAGNLRQWRLVQLPVAAVNFDGRPNVLTLIPQKAMTIYGQYRYGDARDKKLLIPSLYGFSALRLSILGDSRTTDTLRPRLAGSMSLYNTAETADLAPDKAGKQTGDYRIYLILACSAPAVEPPIKPAQPLHEGTMTFKNFFSEAF